jgi:hypothetical protein
VTDLQKRKPLPPGATILDGVGALIPGSERYAELIKGIQDELVKTLPLLGVILNTTHPITLTNQTIPEEILRAIKRNQGRDLNSQWLTKYADELQRQFPTIPRHILAQILSSIEGVEQGNIQRLHLEQETGAETEVQFEVSPNKAEPKIITKSAKKQPAEAAQAVSPKPRPLGKSDLEILKRVPRSNKNQSANAA